MITKPSKNIKKNITILKGTTSKYLLVKGIGVFANDTITYL